MSGLSPGVLFQTPGFNTSSTPVEPLTTSEEILEQHIKTSFHPTYPNSTEWPKDSPIATMYDVGNSSTQMILLNNRMKRSNRLRGQGRPSESARFRRDDPGQDEVYEAPDPDRHFAHRGESFVNRDRHSSCQAGGRGPTLHPIFFPNASISAPVRPPKSLRDVRGLMHPQLTVGQRNYLFSTAHVYSQAGTKALLKNGYYDLLRKQLKKASRMSRICFSSDEEYARYNKWIFGKHKRLYEDDPSVWRGSSRTSSTRTQSSTASPRSALPRTSQKSARQEPKSARPEKSQEPKSARPEPKSARPEPKSARPEKSQEPKSTSTEKMQVVSAAQQKQLLVKKPTPKPRNERATPSTPTRSEKVKKPIAKSPALSGIGEEAKASTPEAKVPDKSTGESIGVKSSEKAAGKEEVKEKKETPASPPEVEKKQASPPEVEKKQASPPEVEKTPSPPEVKKTPASPPEVKKTPASPPEVEKTPASPPEVEKTPASPPEVEKKAEASPPEVEKKAEASPPLEVEKKVETPASSQPTPKEVMSPKEPSNEQETAPKAPVAKDLESDSSGKPSDDLGAPKEEEEVRLPEPKLSRVAEVEEVVSLSEESIPEETSKAPAVRTEPQSPPAEELPQLGAGQGSPKIAQPRGPSAFDDRPPPTPLDELEY